MRQHPLWVIEEHHMGVYFLFIGRRQTTIESLSIGHSCIVLGWLCWTPEISDASQTRIFTTNWPKVEWSVVIGELCMHAEPGWNLALSWSSLCAAEHWTGGWCARSWPECGTSMDTGDHRKGSGGGGGWWRLVLASFSPYIPGLFPSLTSVQLASQVLKCLSCLQATSNRSCIHNSIACCTSVLQWIKGLMQFTHP